MRTRKFALEINWSLKSFFLSHRPFCMCSQKKKELRLYFSKHLFVFTQDEKGWQLNINSFYKELKFPKAQQTKWLSNYLSRWTNFKAPTYLHTYFNCKKRISPVVFACCAYKQEHMLSNSCFTTIHSKVIKIIIGKV